MAESGESGEKIARDIAARIGGLEQKINMLREEL